MPNSSDMALLGRMGAFALHSRYDSRVTLAGRAKFLSRFERQVDPTGELDPAGTGTACRTRQEAPHGEAGVGVVAQALGEEKANRSRGFGLGGTA